MKIVLKLILLIFIATQCVIAQDEKIRLDYISMLCGTIITFFIKEIKPKKKTKKSNDNTNENVQNSNNN